MKKGLLILALWPILLAIMLVYVWHTKNSHKSGVSERNFANLEEIQGSKISEGQDLDAEDLHDSRVLEKYFADKNNFTSWYKDLNQIDKNIVLAGSVYSCHPDLTKTALKSGGDAKINVEIGRVECEEGSDYSVYFVNILGRDANEKQEFGTLTRDDMRKRMDRAADYIFAQPDCDMIEVEGGYIDTMTLPTDGFKYCEDADKRYEMMKLWEENGLNINEVSNDYLLLAVKNNDIKLMKYLLQKGADFSQTGALLQMIRSYSYSKLHQTKTTNDMWDYVTSYLQDHPLTLEAATDAYVYGSYMVLSIGDKSLKTRMDKLNLQPDYTTKAAMEGLLKAASGRDYTMLKNLVDGGVNVNYQNEEGRTALFYAVQNPSRTEDVDAVKYLLDHGADVTIKDKNGKTAFEYCRNDKICRLNPKGVSK